MQDAAVQHTLLHHDQHALCSVEPICAVSYIVPGILPSLLGSMSMGRTRSETHFPDLALFRIKLPWQKQTILCCRDAALPSCATL